MNIKLIGEFLKNPDNPLKARFRALFVLKNINTEEAVHLIGNCFTDDSDLLKHELAYCLGQMQDMTAVEILIKILRDSTEDPMVRHESAEALGALGQRTDAILAVLKEYAQDPRPEVAETCQIALDRLDFLEKKKQGLIKEDENNSEVNANPYYSVDPAPPAPQKNVPHLRELLIDESASMFERYRAMFALRNLGTDEAVEALCAGLKCQGSALFRHEIAFVLGQMQSPLSVQAMRVNLEDVNENHMVRHECAEAIGSVATKECEDILNQFIKDKEPVVRESCEVALDIVDYEKSNEFQYADGLLKV